MPAQSRPRPRPNPAGIHHLSCRRTLRALIRGAALAPGELVYDLGAGPGTITAALAAIGARVVAVERDRRFVDTLRRRFDDHERVSVVAADLRTVAIPRAARVVANLPFATSGALIERLLDPPAHLAPAPTCSSRRASPDGSATAGRARRMPPGAPPATRSCSCGACPARPSRPRPVSTARCCGSARARRCQPTPSGGCAHCSPRPTAAVTSAPARSLAAPPAVTRGGGCSPPPASRPICIRSRCRRTSGRRWREAGDRRRRDVRALERGASLPAAARQQQRWVGATALRRVVGRASAAREGDAVLIASVPPATPCCGCRRGRAPRSRRAQAARRVPRAAPAGLGWSAAAARSRARPL